jgi:D-arabinose 5-phosphate isomerase GutQ
MIKVFLSYSHEDKDKTLRLYRELENSGISVWLDKKKLHGGVEWESVIEKEISTCNYFLTLLSNNSLDDEGYFYKELRMALERSKKMAFDRVFIIPIKIDHCHISKANVLSGLHIIDLSTSGLDEAGIREIKESIKPIKSEENDSAGKEEDTDKITKFDEMITGVSAYKPPTATSRPPGAQQDKLFSDIHQRLDTINDIIKATLEASGENIRLAIERFSEWMLNGTLVRVIGAGRARLAAAIPANRLAHGGARIYIQDDIVPMPHSIKGGGIIAVSASGKTESVINTLKDCKEKNERFFIIGFADNKAKDEFVKSCDLFIGFHQDSDLDNPLKALADTGEFVIAMLLDAMVVAAGKQAGFDDAKWQLGHEDIGKTGPYDLNFKSTHVSGS